jgi:hypothetical protein
MSAEILKTYLNDHLAGSVAALELLDHLIQVDEKSDRESFYRRLRAEIEEDQKVVQTLLEQAGGRESPVRKAAAWLSEKVGQAKLAFDDPGGNQLRILEALETLALGIQGKLFLWRALASVPDSVPAARSVDLTRLQGRAKDQFERVDAERLRIARIALAT